MPGNCHRGLVVLVGRNSATGCRKNDYHRYRREIESQIVNRVNWIAPRNFLLTDPDKSCLDQRLDGQARQESTEQILDFIGEFLHRAVRIELEGLNQRIGAYSPELSA
jgi:hypothetical protein